MLYKANTSIGGVDKVLIHELKCFEKLSEVTSRGGFFIPSALTFSTTINSVKLFERDWGMIPSSTSSLQIVSDFKNAEST